MATQPAPATLSASPDGRWSQPRSVRDVIDALFERDLRPDRTPTSPIATGFDLIDRVLDGGLRPHDLMLLGGSPGVGKTVTALQMARNMARNGRTAIYVSYEHDDPTMFGRLLVLELGDMATPTNAPACSPAFGRRTYVTLSPFSKDWLHCCIQSNDSFGVL